MEKKMELTHPYATTCGDWNVLLGSDEDGHLSVYVCHKDGTEIIDCQADIGNKYEWAERFTTEKIEKDYVRRNIARNIRMKDEDGYPISLALKDKETIMQRLQAAWKTRVRARATRASTARADAEEEYARAWDAAGVIWAAAEEAEVTDNNVESARLWALLAPYDEGAKDRLEHMFVVLAFERIYGTCEQRREKVWTFPSRPHTEN